MHLLCDNVFLIKKDLTKACKYMNNSINKSPELYRSGVGIVLLNNHNQVLIAQRIDFKSDAWQMPQGGIDEGEEPVITALRELEEEIGTNNVEILGVLDEWFYYDLPAEIQTKVWGGNYLGQRQKWFLAKFLGCDSDVNLDTAHPEFSRWKWATPQDAINLAIPFKREIYKKVFQDFALI